MSERVWVAVLILLLVGGAVGYFVLVGTPPQNEGRRGSRFPPPGETQSLGHLDEGWTVANLDGKPLRMGDLRGKVVFINHWATWCDPCLKEMPSIQALYESLLDSDVVFVIVSEEKQETVRQFVRSSGWSLPVYVTARFPPVLDTPGIPATFVVDREGQVVFHHSGFFNWDSDDCRQFLKRF
jgi:thiol-disulfide isomerase/thioredoxin